VGYQRGLIKKFKINAADGILIEFNAANGKPVLSAIRVRKL